jgi:hypothetical protein
VWFDEKTHEAVLKRFWLLFIQSAKTVHLDRPPGAPSAFCVQQPENESVHESNADHAAP